jgi:hypothetical protein
MGLRDSIQCEVHGEAEETIEQWAQPDDSILRKLK